MSPILVTGAILGQHKMTKPMAAANAKLFGPGKSEQALLNEVPMRGTATPDVADRPAALPLHGQRPGTEVLIEEEFGDGIMSAIDFEMDITRKADLKGDRVAIGIASPDRGIG